MVSSLLLFRKKKIKTEIPVERTVVCFVSVAIVALGQDAQTFPSTVHVSRGVEFRNDPDTSFNSIFHELLDIIMSVDLIRKISTVNGHLREAGTLEGETHGINQVPVEHVELAVRHRIHVLFDDLRMKPMAGSINHYSTESEAGLIGNRSSVNSRTALNQLRQRFEGVNCAEYGGSTDLNSGSSNSQMVALISIKGLGNDRIVINDNRRRREVYFPFTTHA